jgi:hypothetical protein
MGLYDAKIPAVIPENSDGIETRGVQDLLNRFGLVVTHFEKAFPDRARRIK